MVEHCFDVARVSGSIPLVPTSSYESQVGSNLVKLKDCFKMKKQDIKPIIKDFQLHDGDTGSISVQIALLTDSIKRLTKHLQENKKDFSTKRGLLKDVGRRKRYLSYLKKIDEKKYKDVITKLGLRR